MSGGKRMFSKKSLHISLAFILLIALATLGLAYGFWTETLTIDGTVGTGELNVGFTDLYFYDYDFGGVLEADLCAVTIVGDTMTISIDDAYPGYGCSVSANVANIGTIPAKIQPPSLINNTSPWPPFVHESYLANHVLQPGETALFTIIYEIPGDVTGDEGENGSYEFTYTISAGQVGVP
jgi:hypothetical protein